MMEKYFQNYHQENIERDMYKIWKDQLTNNSEGKFRIYVKFKNNYAFEKFLNIMNHFELRKS